jgi:hypothetical protein
MIVHGIERHQLDDARVARTAILSRDDGLQSPATVVVPADFAPPEPDDATGLLPFALLLSMGLGEDLDIHGRVDPDLLARTEQLQDHYLTCGAGRLRRANIETAGPLQVDGLPSPFAATCLSRGVDSLYQAARRRSAAGPLDALVFVDHFEPIHDDAVRDRERSLAREAAAVIGLPLIIADAPLRELADALFDWEDAVGAALACVGHALSGGLGRLVIPASDFIQQLSPSGHGPGLDPLFSGRRMQLEPGDISQSRMGKVAWLAQHQPELMPLVKVCFMANRPDNCGRCGKCMHTMACLRAAGALQQATGFPPELDLEAFAAERVGTLSEMVEFAALRDAALVAGDRALARAVDEALRRSAASHRVSAPTVRPSFRARHSDAMRTLLRDGVRDPDAATWGRYGRSRPGIGLVRTLDLRSRCHVHGAGWRPAGVITAELGALMPEGMEAAIALWILPDGRVATVDAAPVGSRARPAKRLRHALSPLIGQGGVRRAARRMLDLVAVPPIREGAADPERPPQGYLYDEPGANRVALWVGEHPITGDQYTATSAEGVLEGGYDSPRLLGHLEARAPVTGLLGVHATPIIPWV